MSITNLIVLLANLFLSFPLLIQQPITNDIRKISTPRSGVQDLIVTHYECSIQHITNKQYYKLNIFGV